MLERIIKILVLAQVTAADRFSTGAGVWKCRKARGHSNFRRRTERVGATLASYGGRSPKPRPLGGDWFTSIAWRPAHGDQPAVSGGEIYPTLIRRTPIKPLKIFIQDGSNDLNNQYGDWFLANQQMVSALEWANANPSGAGRGGRGARDGAATTGPSPVRYQVNHALGDGGHTANHGASLFPDIMRWLWKDYQH